MRIYGDLDFRTPGDSAILNVRIDPQSSNPSSDKFAGRIVYNTTDELYYFCDNSLVWRPFGVSFSDQFSIVGGVVSLAADLGDLEGVDDSVGQNDPAGSMLVAEGSPTGYGSHMVQYIYQSSGASVSHTINHNIGQKYVNITVYDDSANEQQIIPESVTLMSEDQLVVTFGSSINCTAVIIGVPGVS